MSSNFSTWADFNVRDESLVMKAVETFREGNKNGALKLLERSTAAIDELVCLRIRSSDMYNLLLNENRQAELWGFKFLVICGTRLLRLDTIKRNVLRIW